MAANLERSTQGRSGQTERNRVREWAGQSVQRIFGREREYATRKEYAERVITVGVSNAYRLGPWV